VDQTGFAGNWSAFQSEVTDTELIFQLGGAASPWNLVCAPLLRAPTTTPQHVKAMT
jgi:hypothetical protein